MKSKFLIYFILSTSTLISQSIVATYEINNIEDPYDDDYRNNYPEFYEKTMSRFKESKDLIFVLKSNKTKAIFSLKNTLNTDDEKITASLVDGNHVFFTNLIEKKVYDIHEYWGENITLFKPLNFYLWEKTNIYKKINNYNCQLLKTVFNEDIGGIIHNIQVEIWLTKDIPFDIGPFEFSGLGGFVIMLKRNHISYRLKNINFSKKNILLNQPISDKLMDMKTYSKETVRIKENMKRKIINNSQ